MEGSYTAIITPFNEKGVDYDSLERLISTQINAELAGIVPCGTTGESPTLTHKEHREVVEFSIKKTSSSKLKIIAGAGSNSTEEAIGLAKDCEKLGADGVLVVSPYYNKPTQEGLYQHYKKIAESIGIEVVVYNIPSRTGVLIEVETMERIAEIKNINTIKDATGNIDYTGALISKCPDLDVLSGNDSMNLPIYSLGGKGSISVLGNIFPRDLNEVYKLYCQGEVNKAKQLHLKYWPLMEALFLESNPTPVKNAAYMMDIIKNDMVRLPLMPISIKIKNLLKTLLKDKVIID